MNYRSIDNTRESKYNKSTHAQFFSHRGVGREMLGRNFLRLRGCSSTKHDFLRRIEMRQNMWYSSSTENDPILDRVSRTSLAYRVVKTYNSQSGEVKLCRYVRTYQRIPNTNQTIILQHLQTRQ